MQIEWCNAPRRKVAVAGLALVAAPLFFLGAAVLNEVFGVGWLFAVFEPFYRTPERLRLFNIVSPIVFLGGSLAALVLNTLAVVTFRAERVDRSVIGSISADFRAENVVAAALGCFVMAVMAAYFFVENFRLLATH